MQINDTKLLKINKEYLYNNTFKNNKYKYNKIIQIKTVQKQRILSFSLSISHARARANTHAYTTKYEAKKLV